MTALFDDGLEGANRRAAHLPRFIVVIVILIVVLFTIIIVIVLIHIIVVVVTVIHSFIFVIFFTIYSIRVIGIVRQERQSGRNDLGKVRCHLGRTLGHKGFQPHETGLAQFIGQGNGGVIVHIVIVITHVGVNSSRIFIIVLIIVVISGNGFFGIGKLEKDGNDAIHLLLSQAMSDGSTYRAHGPNQCSGVVLTIFGIFHQRQQAFHHGPQQGIAQHHGQTAQSVSGSLADHIVTGSLTLC